MKRLDKIFIPTLGRVNNQITFEGMPDWLKNITYFVIQPKEKQLFDEKYPTANKVILPENNYGISNTRKWIIEQGGDTLYGMLDDDLTFWKRNCDRKTLKKNADKSNVSFAESDWKDMVLWIEQKIDEGFVVCGSRKKGMPPNRTEDYDFGYLTGIFFINGELVDRDTIDWDIKYQYAEDIYFILQLLQMGCKTTVSDKYLYDSEAYGADGGCTLSGRTSEDDITAINNLSKKYPNFVIMQDVFYTHKGSTILNQKYKVKWRKAYNPHYGKENKFW